MNGWLARALLIVLFWAVVQVHAAVMKALSLPPTDEAGAFFFLTAATVDWLLLYSAPRLISGRLCDDIQASCIATIVDNCVGLALYLAYTPTAINY